VARTSGQALLEMVGPYPSGQTEVDSGYGESSSGAVGDVTHVMNWQELEGHDNSEIGFRRELSSAGR
jgi:hypothetical protein